MPDPKGVLLTKDIDATGKIAEFEMGISPSNDTLVSLMVEGSAAADYEVYLGISDSAGGVHYFGNPPGGTSEASYSAVTEISDEWHQAERFVGVWVTSAATSGATAELALSVGR